MKYQDKARGMLVGLAVGDALGAPVEFLPAPSDFYIKEMDECPIKATRFEDDDFFKEPQR